MRVKEESKRTGLELSIKNLRPWHPAPLLHGKYKGKGGSNDRVPLLGF